MTGLIINANEIRAKILAARISGSQQGNGSTSETISQDSLKSVPSEYSLRADDNTEMKEQHQTLIEDLEKSKPENPWQCHIL